MVWAVWDSHSWLEYTPLVRRKSELFERFEGGLLGELPLTTTARDEIDRFAYRHRRPEVQAHASVSTGRTGDFLQAIGHIRLGAEVKFHVRIEGKAVKAFLTHAPPFAVRLHEPLIDAEAGALADGAFHGAQPLFDLLNRRSRHPLSSLVEYNVGQIWTASDAPAPFCLTSTQSSPILAPCTRLRIPCLWEISMRPKSLRTKSAPCC